MKINITSALGLIGLSVVSGCGGGSNNAVTTVPTAHLAITLPAGTVKAGAPFTFTVNALDATNAVVPTYAGTVQITTSDKSATLPANATLTQGKGTFTLTFDTGGGYTITASDTVGNATAGTSAAVIVSSGHLAITLPAGAAEAAAPFTFTVSVLDAANAVVPTYTGTVQITTSDKSAKLPANATLTRGKGTFTVTFGTVGSYTITASDTVGYATAGTSAAVSVSFPNAWTWVSGSNTIFPEGVYGTQGVAAAANVPGARNGSVTWTDSAGNLWLFGGSGFDSNGTGPGILNDLWRYSPGSGLWTWVSGANTINYSQGVYGTQGVAAVGNVPSGRVGHVSWTDSAGNLWLFGGSGSDSAGAGGELNDLWRYHPNTGLWTWVSGSNLADTKGVYGTRGVAAAGNVPGARGGAVSWIDSAGNLWLFGGSGYDSAGAGGELNDLWRYSPNTGLWTWVSGANTINAQEVYGTQGVAAAANVPGARNGSTSWIDSAGNLWLFGGGRFDSAGSGGELNDLWRYSPNTGLWTWISGSNTSNALGVHGTQGVAAAGNVPGAREDSNSWTDSTGSLWLFGGSDYNDLWRYSPGSGLWTWVRGSNTRDAPGVYGTQGVAAAGSVPGGRDGSVSWIDSAGNLWLFGGAGVPSAGTGGPLNDLWRFGPDSGP
jgi:N-acetylneuraminic acid mutarotase